MFQGKKVLQQCRRKGVLTGMLALCAALLLVAAVYSYHAGFGYVVTIDGAEVAFLAKSDLKELTAFIDQLTDDAEIAFQMQVMRNETLDFVEDRRPGEHQSIAAVKDELRQRLSFSTYGYILTVDGRETVALKSVDDYDRVLRMMKKSYAAERENAVLKDFVIQEEIDFIKRPVQPDEIVSVEEAANILLTGLPQRKTHLVARGDSLWSISRAHNISMAALEAANPQIINRQLKPNDELNLVTVEPLVNVLTVEEVTVTEKIPFTTKYVKDNKLYTSQTKVLTNGKMGEKEVTYLITVENGQETARRVVKETVLSEPVDKVVAKGTAAAPKSGTGRFIWPLASGGTITSTFGPRWGKMHYAVDIAAAGGTPIRAADGGVVTTSSYRGSYGNLVVIDHGNGYSTYYAHNSRLLVKVGERVAKGQTIALMGSTGNSTGNHVHFEIRKHGTPINPLQFF